MNNYKKYNIHSLLTIEIEEGLEDTNRIYDFLGYLGNIDSKEVFNKIIVNKVKSLNFDEHREYADGLYISPFSFIDKKYGIEIIIKENEIVLNTKFRFIEWLMYSIQLALLRVDAALIHGAAVSKNNKSILFPSWGGVGKTAILNDFTKKYDYEIVGDDLFILTKDGKVFSFPKPMVLYPYHKNLFPEIFKKNPSKIPVGMTKVVSRLVPKIKKLLSPFPALMNFARNHNPQVKWALPSEVFGVDKICHLTQPIATFWIERSHLENQIDFENPNLISQILGSTMNEFDQRIVYSVNILMGLGFLNNKDYFDKWYQILKNGLENSKQGFINIKTSVSIDDVGSVVYQFVGKLHS